MNTEWWEVFDVDREELGFLVVALGSCKAWLQEEMKRWEGKGFPMDLEGLEEEITRRELEET